MGTSFMDAQRIITKLNLALQQARNAADDFDDFLKVVYNLWTTRINSGEG
jgi:hypothetical protein